MDILATSVVQRQAQGGTNGHQEHAERNSRACVTQIFFTAFNSTLSFVAFVEASFRSLQFASVPHWLTTNVLSSFWAQVLIH